MTHAPVPQAPPFCPYPACSFHRERRSTWRYEKIGFFSRKSPPLRVQRYLCLACGRSFSDQTFKTTYWLKRADLLESIFKRLQSCSGFRQIAREEGCSPTTIAGQSARLGRHSLLYHELHRPRGPIEEELSMDSFESFEWSQYHPSSYHVAAGRTSHFFHGFTTTELRRKGSMTDHQRKVRADLETSLGRPDPKGVERDFAELLRIVFAMPQALVLNTDEHPAYVRALVRVPHLTVDHRTVSSRAARIPQNPLFPVNLIDGLVRHSASHHKRETIAFVKRLQSGCERMASFLVWRNWNKPFSERARKEDRETPAMRLGLTDRIRTVGEILEKRLFPSRIALPKVWEDYYWRRITTRAIANCRTHQRVFAV